MSLEFIEQKKNILCIGAVGTGKTYLATALGVKACCTGQASTVLSGGRPMY
jgi:DNA replication protein DnaC